MKACAVIAVIFALACGAECRMLRGASVDADAKAIGGPDVSQEWGISATAPSINMALAAGSAVATGKLATASLDLNSANKVSKAEVDLNSLALAKQGTGTAAAAGTTWVNGGTAIGFGVTGAEVDGEGLTASKGKEQAITVDGKTVVVAKGSQEALSVGKDSSTLVKGLVITTPDTAASDSKSLARNADNKAQSKAGADAEGGVPVKWFKLVEASTATKATTLPRSASADALAEALGRRTSTRTATFTESRNP